MATLLWWNGPVDGICCTYWLQSLHIISTACVHFKHPETALRCKLNTLVEACLPDNPAVGGNQVGTKLSQPSHAGKCAAESGEHSSFAAGLLAPLAAGGTVIIPAGGKFSAGTFWRDATEHGATYYTAVPTMHQVSGGCVR